MAKIHHKGFGLIHWGWKDTLPPLQDLPSRGTPTHYARLGFSGAISAIPGGPESRLGFTRHPENSKRAHLRVPVLQNTTRIPREDTQRERHKKAKMEAGGKKRNFGQSGAGEGGLSAGEKPTTTTTHTHTHNKPQQQHTQHTQHTQQDTTPTRLQDTTQHNKTTTTRWIGQKWIGQSRS